MSPRDGSLPGAAAASSQASSPDPAGGGFVLTRVTLAGFGLYAQPCRFLFPSGPAIFTGANESGKTTLLAGLSAVLFGLPAISDPTRFGTARFRSVPPPREFWGEVEWQAGGRRYCLHRAFESHQVRLVEEGPKGSVTLFTGEHNPKATSSAGSAFLEELTRHFGLTSREVFEQTFCVTQPLIGELEISSDLQRLLSGSRSGHKDDVLCRLFDEIKTLTRATGDQELTRPGKTKPANQREAGRIEILEESLERAGREQEEGRTLLDQLNANNEELEATQETIRQAVAAAGKHTDRLRILHSWLDSYQERKRRGEAIPQIQNTLRELEDIEREKEGLRPLLDGPHARFRQAPEDLPERLEALEQVLAESTRLRREAEDAVRGREQIAAQAAALEEELAKDFQDVRGRPELPEVREQLAAALGKQEGRLQSIAQTEDEIIRLKARLDEEGQGEEINPEALQLQAEACVRGLGRLESVQSRLEEIARQSEERVFLSGTRLQELREKIASEIRLKELRGQIRELEARIAQEARPLPAAPAGRISGPISPWIGVVAGMAAGGTLGFGLDQGWAISLGGGVLVFLILWTLNLLLGLRRRRRQGRAATLRPPGGVPAADLPGLDPELDRLRAEETALREKAEALAHDLGPYAFMTRSELDTREERWRLFDEEAEKLHREHGWLLSRWFGPEEIPDSLSGEWRRARLAALAAFQPLLGIPGAPPEPSAGDLLDWLRSLDPSAWRQIQASANRRREARGLLEQAQRSLEFLSAHADEAVEQLRTRLAPFTLETPAEALKARLAECEDRERRLHALSERLSGRPSVEDAQAQLIQATSKRQTLWQELRTTWPAAASAQVSPEEPLSSVDVENGGEDKTLAGWVRLAREQERPARAAWLKAAELENSARRILSAARAASREELVERQTEANAVLGNAIREMEELERREIWLTAETGQDLTSRALTLSRMLEETRFEQQRETAEREKLEEKARQILKLGASLEGRQTSNLAHLEGRIDRERERLRLLRRDRDALVQAFRWVEEAAELYSRAYRGDLEARITERFGALTGVPERKIRLDEGFSISLVEPRGDALTLAQLSQGARDQLSLAVRLAVADLLTDAVPLPLFFDDPFVHYDAGRLQNLRRTLDTLGRERQWVLLTHREDLGSWAEPVRREETEGA